MKPPETGIRVLGGFTVYTECQASFPVVRIGFPHPTQSPARECFSSPTLGPRGETHSLAGEGVGEPYSDEGADTLVLYLRVYYNPSTVYTHHKASVSIICLFSFFKEKTSVFLATIQKSVP
jgi:hypothetical protein